jgi:hypothetical protein
MKHGFQNSIKDTWNVLVYIIYIYCIFYIIYIYILFIIYIYIYIYYNIYIYAFTNVYHQYVDRRGNRHIPLSAGFHDSQERHCQMCKQCDLSLPGDRMDPETTTLCHRSPIPGDTLSQWSLPDTSLHPLCGSRSSLSSSKRPFNAVSGHIANERVGWKSLHIRIR